MNGKTFNVPVSNGLLEPKHYRAMGDAIWLYLYLLDKQTRRVDKDGHGKVSGGMPIRDSVIAGALGSSRRTVIRWRGVLERGGYITARRTSFGHVYAITKPKKWKETTQGDVTQPAHHSSNNSDVMCRFGTGDVQVRVQTKKTLQDSTVVRKEPATASPSEMEEKELLSIWNYYLDAFDKDETFTPQRKKQGLERMRELGAAGTANWMSAAIDMAKELSEKKTFFRDWHCIFGKKDTFASLLQQYEEMKDPPPRSFITP